MEQAVHIARSELILGGQKSGKSRRAELLARTWLQTAGHHATLIATAQAHDAEMHARIARHQRERAERVPGLQLVEEPRDLAGALAKHSRADTLLIVDCLTLWLTHWLMPAPGAGRTAGAATTSFEQNQASAGVFEAQCALFFVALEQSPGPVILVGNEIGLGVIPLGREVRAFVDALGLLNQRAAAACQRVTLMAAGLALTLKDTP
ncbi:adenosylcobinamide-phosphate guanylyltransferase [Melaminivora suipulveris]|uniref:Bifunctional adenosylcobalamin biosynthesis protein n=1 Tax=Melaminivora suipulveris TaxID=2109913 RepID=A0A2R3Q7Z2_9BURK|nr:bifunctional adenosylcobinamide kinase/adenosylcobinamide-phosphate guanylyltransferase [Melaminivora suipulveris]AVO47890.1 adenosylcobinamide-phosphate guanylyltransferase [Melaminivora suipulveris]